MKTNFKKFILMFIAFFAMTFISNSLQAQESGDKTYVQIRVDGLSCPFCAYGLEKKLKKVDGATNLFIALEEGIVNLDVPSNKKPSEESLRKVVTDAGFTPREIKFSDTPFKKEGDDS